MAKGSRPGGRDRKRAPAEGASKKSRVENGHRALELTAGGALLARLKTVGVDYIFANSGTDFPPLIEGLAEAAANGIDLPQSLVIPHEGAAMGMAHGYFLATGRAQAVMAHTNVGLANCALGAINAATERVPILLFSGRTPTLEAGRLGARTVPIGWGQEMRDQSALVREAAKWDYELRFPEQVPDVVDRAYAIATSTPRGPVYVSLPREVLCAPCPSAPLALPPAMAARVTPSASLVEEVAALLAAADNPVFFAQRGAGSPAGFAALAEIADIWSIPVVQYWAVQLALATDHPMAAGADPSPWLEEADVVVVLDCLAPWSPALHAPKADCRVVQIGADPLHARFPVRGFRADISVAGELDDMIVALAEALRGRADEASDRRSARRARVEPRIRRIRSDILSAAAGGRGSPPTKEFVGLALSDAIAGKRVTVLSELGAPLFPMQLRAHGSWYQEPHSGGLGWAFPAALGMQLADRERLVVATMGDGSYIFSNPAACHQIAEALALPVLVVVLNNAEWGAVRQSVLGLYPDGHAARANEMPLTSLSPSPDFTKYAQASRGWAARADSPEGLETALAEAIAHIETHRTHALIDVTVRA